MTMDTAELDQLAYSAVMPGVCTELASSTDIEPWLAAALAAGVESVCLFSDAIGTIERARQTASVLHSVRPVLLIATDEEGGEVTRLQTHTGSSVLAPLALGVINDPAVTRQSAELLGYLLGQAGIDWTLAPDADVNVDPRNPVIGVRSFGTDADHVASHVAAYVEGMQHAGVLACAKHFPGHGDTHVDSHESLPRLSVSAEVLGERELRPFTAAARAHVASIMTGHLLVDAFDRANPASLSYAITTDLLRSDLGFAGAIITDAVEMGAVAGPDGAHLGEAVVASLLAGADVVCIGAARQEWATNIAVEAIKAAVIGGRLPVDRLLDAAAHRAALRVGRSVRGIGVNDLAHLVTAVADAAPQSLALTGNVVITSDAVDVLRISATPGYAAGPTTWGVAPHLEASGVEVRIVNDSADAGSENTPLVIELRDVWKSSPLTKDFEAALVAATSQGRRVVVVDFGWPMEPHASATGWVATHGTGLLSSALAAAALTGTNAADAARAVLEDAIAAVSEPQSQPES